MRKRVVDLLEDVSFEIGERNDGGETCEVQGIACSSLAVTPGDLFFCVPGLKSDGHRYVADARGKGAVALVVERFLDEDIPQFKVVDARRTLALASARFYDRPSEQFALAGITGTNGKTTTAFLVEWVARSLGARTGLIGTVETRVGDLRRPAHNTTPESLDLQRLFAEMRDAGVSHAVMEVSSHAIDLDRIAGTRFAVCGFSNLTQDHLDYHKDMEHYFLAKAALFDPSYCQKAAICIDDAYGKRLRVQCEERGIETLTCGFDAAADVSPCAVTYLSDRTEVSVRTPEGVYALTLPLIGRFNVENLLLAAALCRLLGFGYREVFDALVRVPQVPGRLERVEASDAGAARHQGFSVFVDYSHTPDSIEKALRALRPITPGRLIIVFGCGGDRDKTKRPKMAAAAARIADFVVVTSDNPRSEDPCSIIDDILPGLDGFEAYEVEPDRRSAIRRAVVMAREGDAVLIAGKGHEDYQIVGDTVLSFDDRIVAAEELSSALR
jgi:UDP-N-acetylmuramoyl-L-alanyl-D-glutamate--2,6-diaminopimelate ligase